MLTSNTNIMDNSCGEMTTQKYIAIILHSIPHHSSPVVYLPYSHGLDKIIKIIAEVVVVVLFMHIALYSHSISYYFTKHFARIYTHTRIGSGTEPKESDES